MYRLVMLVFILDFLFLCCVFFKQKTAYEMRIIDWSSDVCSSDLTWSSSFSIMEKDEDYVSNLYDAPMPYMLRLTNDGVAIHGSEVEWGLATHGCIGIPTKFAALLFSQAGLGNHVIITKGKMLRVRSEERSEGNEGVSMCRFRWWP